MRQYQILPKIWLAKVIGTGAQKHNLVISKSLGGTDKLASCEHAAHRKGPYNVISVAHATLTR